MSARARVWKGLAGSIFSRGVLILNQTLSIPLLLARWGTAGYGEWIALTAMAAYLAYSNIGVPGTVRSEMAVCRARGDDAGAIRCFQTCIAMVLAVALVAGAGFTLFVHHVSLAKLLHASYLDETGLEVVATAFAWQIVLVTITGIISAALSSYGRYGFASALDASRQFAEFMCVLLVVGVLAKGPTTLALIYPITSAIHLVIASAALVKAGMPLRKLRLSVDFGILRRLIAPMAGVLWMSFGYYGMAVQAPRIILAMTLGPRAVSVYAMATMLMRMVRIPIEIPAHAATVEISLAVGEHAEDRARAFLSRTTQMSLWTALLATPVVILLGPTICHIWSAGRVSVPMELLALLSVSTIFFSVALPNQEGLMAINRLQHVTWPLALASLPFLLLLYYGAQHLGLTGVGGAILCLEAAYAWLAVQCSISSFHYQARDYAKSILAPPRDLIHQEIARVRGLLARA